MSNFSVDFQEGIQEVKNNTKVVNMAIKRKTNFMNGFVKLNMDTWNVPGKMFPI